jgi:CRISPR system Cascade subunit CasE
VVALEQVELLGMSARARLLRRARNGGNRLLAIERPQALFAAEAVIREPARFADYLTRGIGRHRAFGFGMVLLAPPR